MTIFSKTYNDSTYELMEGNLNESLPLITNGLVAYFPFDGESIGFQGDASTRINPSNESNTTNSFKEGLGLSSPTTNLISGITAVWYPWAGIVGTSIDYSNFYKRNAVHVTVTTSGGAQVYAGPNFAAAASTKYTVSATVKMITGTPSANLFYIREYRANATQVVEHGEFNSSKIEYLQGGWYKVWNTFQTNSETVSITLMGYEYNAGVEYKIEDIQVEQRDYYTSYVLGTRSSTGTIKLPITGGLTTYTIVGKFLPHTPFDNTYDITENQSLLFSIQDNTGGDAQYRYYVSGVSSAPFIETSGSFGSTNFHTVYTINANDEIYFVVTKTSTSMICKIYQNEWKPQHTINLSNDTNLANIVLGGAPVWNGDYKELNVYNRILSDAELNQIVSVKQILRADGSLGNYLNEDKNPNLWPNAEFNTTLYTVSGNLTPTLKTDSYGTYHEMVLSNTAWTYKGYDISTNAGETYVFSGMFWLSAGNDFNYTVLQVEDATSTSGGIYCNTLPTEQWVYSQMSCISDGNVKCLIYPTSNIPGTGIIKWRNMCVRKLPSNDIKLNNYGELEVGEFLE